MHRLRLALAALALFAVSCGGSDTEQLLTDLGLSDEEAECLTREYEERDLDVDRLLRVDEQSELTDEEQAGLLEVARICSNIGSDAESGDDAGSGDGDTVAGDTGDDTSTDSDPADDGGDDSDDAADEPDDADDPPDRDELSPLEQAFVDTLVAEGLNATAAMCFLTELEAAGFSIFDLAALGLDETAEPPAGVIAAFLRCGDELADAGITDIEGFFSDGSGDDPDDTEPFTYGDDADFDALWDSCETGDWDACDQLFWLSPIDSEYETFGSTCGLTSEPLGGGCAAAYDGDDEPVGDGGSYGDDPELDALYDACADGDFVACDDLYWDSPLDSEYEAFAATCGGARTGFNGGSCADLAGEPYTYGDDPDLDADWDSCAAGNNTACDDLYLWSPIDSEYETFGSTCGGRSEQEWFGGCKAEFG